MRRPAICCILLGLPLLWGPSASPAAEPMLAHDVYFSLKHDSDGAKEKLLAGCKKYLADHPGVAWFAAGIRVEDHKRDVNDRDFDVALHLVFKDKDSHDRYQKADGHHKFIEEFQGNWKAVRVFDSHVNVSFHAGAEKHKDRAGHGKDRPDKAKKPRLPDAASLFAGMVRGKVAVKYDSGDFALAVTGVVEEWRHSKAKKAKSLVGKNVLVDGRKENGKAVARFIRTLEVGDAIAIDVAHRGKGEALTILELTEQQRKRISGK